MYFEANIVSMYWPRGFWFSSSSSDSLSSGVTDAASCDADTDWGDATFFGVAGTVSDTDFSCILKREIIKGDYNFSFTIAVAVHRG